MSLKRVVRIAALVLAFSANSFSQTLPGEWFGVPGAPLLFAAGYLYVCEGDGYYHSVNYVVFFGGLHIDDKKTDVKCDCNKPSVNTPESAKAANVLAAEFCVTMTADGNDLTYPHPGAPILQDDLTGFMGKGLWNGPAPGGMPFVVVEEERSRFAAASGPAPYPETVPFRQFGLPPLYSGSNVNVTLLCNNAINPTAFSEDHLQGFVYRDNICSGARSAEIRVPTRPLQIRVTPDGRWGLVTSFDNGITFIDTNTNLVASIIRTDSNVNPGGLAISPDGSYALVTSLGQPLMLVVDIAKQAITGTIPIDRDFPQSVYLSPDATLAWVIFPFENVVEVLDVMTGIVIHSIPVANPTDLALNATGTVAYIASGTAQGSVLVVDTKTYSITKTIPAGAGADDLSLSPEGRVLTVNNYFGNSITVIDTATLTSQTIPVPGPPRGVLPVPVQ